MGYEETHVMPERHEQLLRAMTGTEKPVGGDQEKGIPPSMPKLPEKLVKKYWEMKRCFDRIGHPVGPDNLAFLAMLGGYGEPNEQEKRGPNVVELFHAKQLTSGAPVEVEWRGKTVRGEFRGPDAKGNAIVVLAEDGDTRLFDPNKVTILELAAA